MPAWWYSHLTSPERCYGSKCRAKWHGPGCRKNVKSISKGLVFKITDLGEVTQDRIEENSDRSLGPSTLGVGQCRVHERDGGGCRIGGEPVEVGERLSPRGRDCPQGEDYLN